MDGSLIDGQQVTPILAFDFMSISFADLLWAPELAPILVEIFPSDDGDDNDDEDEVKDGNKRKATDQNASEKCKQRI
jgi:hypothetical protein